MFSSLNSISPLQRPKSLHIHGVFCFCLLKPEGSKYVKADEICTISNIPDPESFSYFRERLLSP